MARGRGLLVAAGALLALAGLAAWWVWWRMRGTGGDSPGLDPPLEQTAGRDDEPATPAQGAEPPPPTSSAASESAAGREPATQPLVRVAGIVVDGGSAPIEGAEVTLADSGSRSGSDGRFGFALTETPRVMDEPVVSARRDGYAPFVSRLAWYGVSDLRIVLSRGRRLRGQILDTEDSPVPGAVLILNSEVSHPSHLDPPLAQRITGARGEFEIPDVPRRPLRLVVTAPRCLPLGATLPGGARDLECPIVLERGRTCRLRFVDETGGPVGGARVGIRDESSPFKRWRPWGWTLRTGPDGGLPPFGISRGPHSVSASAPGFEEVREGIKGGEGDVDRTIALPRRDGLGPKVRVRILAGAGASDGQAPRWHVNLEEVAKETIAGRVETIWVRRRDSYALADAAGEALFTRCRPGALYRIMAGLDLRPFADGEYGVFLVRNLWRLEGEEGLVEWSPPALRRVRFSVADDVGSPVPGFRIRLTREEPGDEAAGGTADEGPAGFSFDLTRRGSTTTDASGSGVILVDDGQYTVEADGRDAAVDPPPPLEVRGADAEVTLQARRGVSVRGVLRRSDGAPVAEVRVWASGQHAYRESRTDPEGRFEIRGLEPGPIELGAEGLHGEPRAARLGGISAPASGVELVLRTGRILGKVTSARPRRLRVFLTPGKERFVYRSVETWTRPDGSFEAEDLVEGEWQVLAPVSPEELVEWRGTVQGETRIELRAH